jgi:Spy/CpxP family protein refolding chaperone
LNDQLTNNIGLHSGSGIYACALTAKGKLWYSKSLSPTFFCNPALGRHVCNDDRKPPVLKFQDAKSPTRNLTILKKSRMKKIPITLLALTYATRLFAQAAEPSPADQGKTGTQPVQESMQQRLWERLQLTDDQKEKLKQIREADRDSLRSARAQVTIARESLKAALLANPENIADIQTKATNLANALSTSSVQIALHRAKINQPLTPAQRVALDEARERRMRRGLRPGAGAERGPWQQRRPWQRQNQSPQQKPAAPQDSQTPAAPTG